MYLIVIDANVWVRYARAKSLKPLLDRFIRYNIVPVVNNYLLGEVFYVVTRNGWMTDAQALKLIDLIRRISVTVIERAVYRMAIDPKDNYLFDLAIQQGCVFIISDDSRLTIAPRLVRMHTTAWFLKHFPI